jgi:Reverse transcriptase (RNA-dependent DNA polymerase)
MIIVRILLSIAINKKWTLHQMNIKNAFLQETLEEEVYMMLPLGRRLEKNPNVACRLQKLIYGLKQSPRAWYEKLSSYLTSCNFFISNVDHSLFCKYDGMNTTLVLVYVEDIIITGNNIEEIRKIKI